VQRRGVAPGIAVQEAGNPVIGPQQAEEDPDRSGLADDIRILASGTKTPRGRSSILPVGLGMNLSVSEANPRHAVKRLANWSSSQMRSVSAPKKAVEQRMIE